MRKRTIETDRKLRLKRETLRRLSSLGAGDLARVAGGAHTDQCYDHEWQCKTLGTTSKFC